MSYSWQEMMSKCFKKASVVRMPAGCHIVGKTNSESRVWAFWIICVRMPAGCHIVGKRLPANVS